MKERAAAGHHRFVHTNGSVGQQQNAVVHSIGLKGANVVCFNHKAVGEIGTKTLAKTVKLWKR